MKFHKEGKKVIPVSIGIIALINIGYPLITSYETYVYITILILSLIILGLIMQFFRVPTRHTPLSDTDVIAPADGIIVAHEEVEETEYFHDKRVKVSIFMSPLVPHINWYPVTGKVKFVRYHPGRFLVAWHPKSSDENECTTIVVEREDSTPVLCRQIAGALARRISYYCEEGKKVQQGDEMGFIKFGSRVDVFLPLTAKVTVQLNDAVIGSETVLATV